MLGSVNDFFKSQCINNREEEIGLHRTCGSLQGWAEL